MLDLESAIKHAEEVAKIQENNAKSYPRPDRSVKGSGKRYNAYLKRAEEHRQLIEWLKDYKRLLEQEPCTDAISRKAVLDTLEKWWNCKSENDDIYEIIKAMPSVTPKPKADTLDKIRAEIEQDAFKDANGSKYIFVNRINQIIDKYKAEGSEE